MNASSNPKPAYEPNAAVRLLAWFGIYLAAQLPLIPYAADWKWFPMGLLTPFVYLADKLTKTEIILPNWTLRATYAFYMAHLAATLVVRQPRTFLIMIWALIGLVLFNLAGCEIGQHAH